MSNPDRTFSRRTLLRAAGGLAGAGLIAPLSGCSSQPSAGAPRTSQYVSTGKSLEYHSIPDFHPPRLSVKVNRAGRSPGVVVTDCHLGSGQQGPLILSGDGELIWFRPISTDEKAPRAFNLRAETYKGEPVLTWFQGAVPYGHGAGEYIIADTSYRTIATVKAKRGLKGDLHEFFLTPEGSAVFTAYGTASADLTSFGGASDGLYFFGEFQEVDVATGKLLFWWRSDTKGHVAFDESQVSPPGKASEAWDYMHINALGIDPSDGNFIVSARNTWTIYKVNRTTGAIMWRLGGKQSDFSKDYPSDAHFAYQHCVTPWPGGIFTIFDNEGSPWVNPPSRGLEIVVDEAQRSVALRRQFHHSPPVKSGDLGSVQILPDGHFFIGWGATAYITEYSNSGEVLFDALLEGVESYRAFKHPWSATPAAPPAIAVATTGTTKSVYVSWNGATEVARWRLLGGGATGALKAIATVAKAGFETRISMPAGHQRVAVEALNSSGTVIGRSATHDV